MKTLTTIIAVIFFQISFTSAQTMESFFRNEGIETIALLAHPLSTFESATYEIKSDRILIDIIYTEGRTKLSIDRQKHFFTDIDVLYDSFWISPFSAVEIIKDVALEMVNETDQDGKIVSQFEQFFNRSLYQMSGVNIGCVILTSAWFGY